MFCQAKSNEMEVISLLVVVTVVDTSVVVVAVLLDVTVVFVVSAGTVIACENVKSSSLNL